MKQSAPIAISRLASLSTTRSHCLACEFLSRFEKVFRVVKKSSHTRQSPINSHIFELNDIPALHLRLLHGGIAQEKVFYPTLEVIGMRCAWAFYFSLLHFIRYLRAINFPQMRRARKAKEKIWNWDFWHSPHFGFQLSYAIGHKTKGSNFFRRLANSFLHQRASRVRRIRWQICVITCTRLVGSNHCKSLKLKSVAQKHARDPLMKICPRERTKKFFIASSSEASEVKLVKVVEEL